MAQEHHVDLFDEKAVSQLLDYLRPTDLIHLAWFTEPAEFWQSPLNLMWESRSLHLFASFISNGGGRIVGAGSCAEYEWGAEVLEEGTTPEFPATPYGTAKLSLKRRTEALATEAGIGFSWARFFFLFGPHERKERFVSSIIDPLLRDDMAYCHSGSLIRDFLYVEDAGDAVAALAMSNVQGAVNVGSGIASRLGDVAKDIGMAMHAAHLVHIAPDDPAGTQPKAVVADVSRLTREVGWAPRYTQHDALKRTIAWRAAQQKINSV